MNKLDMGSVALVDKNIEKIGELFPNVIKESPDGLAIDFDVLKQELSGVVIDGNKEKYQLTWPGKKEAIVNANTPTNNTLRPIKEKSVDFDKTENIYIEGDNLEVLKILQESYLNKIKCIYIDPPYNTGNDFIYNDNFEKDSYEGLLESGQIDDSGNRLVSNNQSNGRYHSDWLSMIYPRLKLARNLLTDDGVIFISIDDNEQSNLKKICDEIYGEENFIAQFVWKKTENIKMDSRYVSVNTEYVLSYKKSKCLSFFKEASDEERFSLEDEKGKYYLRKLDSKSSSYSKGMDYIIENDGIKYCAGGDFEKYNIRQNGGAKRKDATWLWSKEKYNWGIENNEIVFKNGNVYNKVRFDGEEKKPFVNLIDFVSVQTAQKELDNLMSERVFDHPKPVELLKFLINLICKDSDIVLDFFAGSSTISHSVMEINAEKNYNLKFISVQINENLNFNSVYKNICDIGQERIRRAAKKIKEETNADIDYGFRVYNLDSSNMKDVYYTAGEYSQDQLDLFESNIKADRTSEDLLTQVMLDLGLKLDLKIEEKELKNNRIYFVENNSLVACFDDNFNIDNIDEICKIKPLKIVFRDSSFKSDNDKINVSKKIKKLSPETEISVI